MSLRSQLLVVSLLLLSLPWAGCQYLREMESTLREGQGMATVATAQALAAALGERGDLLYPVEGRRTEPGEHADWYLQRARGPLIADGYADDWREHTQDAALPGTPPELALQSATRGERLFLMLQVDDNTLRYSRPGTGSRYNGDRLLLQCVDRLGAVSRYVVAAEAPGFVRARRQGGGADRLSDRIRGAWRERANGYAVELQLPLDAYCERLALTVVDATTDSERIRFDTRDLFGGNAAWLVYRVQALEAWLRAFEQPGRELTVRDRQGWNVAQLNTGAVSGATSDTEVFWLLRYLYRAALNSDSQSARREQGNAVATSTAWQLVTEPGSDDVRIRAASPIAGDSSALGTVIVEETTERYLALTDRASTRVFTISAVVLATAFAGLLAYATLLSLRIRRLSEAAGEIAAGELDAGDFPQSAARDELGELSRSYAALLAQIHEYNRYLRGLARTLSHELRTPIAVVGSSLDNLDRDDAKSRRPYLDRARDGLARLSRIVTAMSEASRIEESLENVALEPIDVNALLGELCSAYASTFATHRFSVTPGEAPVPVEGNGDLLAQALDKLVENAVSFAPEGSLIELQLAAEADSVTLSVANAGPPLPAHVGDQLFEPMVSLRGVNTDGSTHLGLGLHVTRTIAAAHHGRLKAENLASGGVVFRLLLPRSQHAAS